MNRSTLLLSAGIFAIRMGLCGGPANAQTFERTQDQVQRKGYDFEFSPRKIGAFTFIEPTTGEEKIRVAGSIIKPVSLNGRKVATSVSRTASFHNQTDNFHDYVFSNLYDYLCKLNDGIYTLNLRDILIDKQGKIVYFGYEGVRNPSRRSLVSLDMQLSIFSQLCNLLEKASFDPGRQGTQRVVSYYDDKDIWEATFKVAGHQLYVSKG